MQKISSSATRAAYHVSVLLCGVVQCTSDGSAYPGPRELHRTRREALSDLPAPRRRQRTPISALEARFSRIVALHSVPSLRVERRELPPDTTPLPSSEKPHHIFASTGQVPFLASSMPRRSSHRRAR